MKATPDTFILINHTAARARRAWPHIRDTLKANGVRFDVHETTCVGDAEAQTRIALRAGYRIIAVVSGDGTLSEVAAGFFEPNSEITRSTFPVPINGEAALAILPAGTGNDFARGLENARASLDKWLGRLLDYYRRKKGSAVHLLDVIQASTAGGIDGDDSGRAGEAGSRRRFICLNAATLGLGAEVAQRVAAQHGLIRRMPGEARFVAAACGALAAWRERIVRVRVDNEVLECASNLIAVANGPYAGGGMMLTPAARPDDGRLDVMVACGVSRAVILRELARIHYGGHLANPKVRTLGGTSVRIETLAPTCALLVEADGNVRGRTPAEFQIAPKALGVIL